METLTTQEHHLRSEQQGSIIGASLWMAFISALLCWLPLLGPFIGGFIGGRHAGGVGRGIFAVFLLAFSVGLFVYFFAALITTLPFIGAIVGMGITTIMIIGAGPMFLGSIIGGIFHK